MTSLAQIIHQKYQVRKTKKQKDAFIDLLQTHYPNMTIQKGGIRKSKNLIIGDVNHAEIFLSAHYDTCSVLPFPNFLTPKNPLFYIGFAILMLIPIFAIIFLVTLFLQLVVDNYWVTYFTDMALYFTALILMMSGPANKHTANDNTSGVITLCEIYAHLTEEEKKKTCLIFFDNEESGLLGSRLFLKKYKNLFDQKLLINFDCVSDGNYIMFSASKGARNKWNFSQFFVDEGNKKAFHTKAERTIYPSDQKGFPNGVAVCALKRNRFLGYYINRIHTSRDTVFDEENITYLTKNTHAFIEALCNEQNEP